MSLSGSRRDHGLGTDLGTGRWTRTSLNRFVEEWARKPGRPTGMRADLTVITDHAGGTDSVERPQPTSRAVTDHAGGEDRVRS
jgi:hypothetical protein